MSRIPRDPREIFEDIISDYKGLFSGDLISIILYGSAVGRDFQPGKSDINFMIVLSDEEIEHVDKAFKTVSKWQKRKVAIPLFLTEQYIQTSTDVFPIEYLNFQRNHLLVYGKDVLMELSFNPGDLRLQCEREIKGKLLILRETYLGTKGKERALKAVMNDSIQAFVAIFAALLFLKDKDIPTTNHGIVKSTCEVFGLDTEIFERLLDVKGEKIKLREEEMKTLFKGYIKEVRKLSKTVDALGG